MDKLKKCFLKDYSYKSHTMENNGVVLHTDGEVKVRLEACFDDTVKIWIAPYGSFTKPASFAVEKEEFQGVPFTVDVNELNIKMVLNEIMVNIKKSPLEINFYTKEEKLISGTGSSMGSGWDEKGHVFMYNDMGKEEHFYGLGQDNDAFMGNLDRRGTSRDLITGQTITPGCVTADIPISFFMSTGQQDEGYGLFLDNSYRTEFNMGAESHDYYYFDAEGGQLLFYIMYGPSFGKILNRYTEITGRSSMLPLWAYGYSQSKCSYKTWDEIDDIIYTLREKTIPMDCMVFDFDWAEQMMNFKFNSRFEGKSQNKFKEHAANGVKFMVSNSGPMIKKDSTNYKSGLEKNIFATDGKGNTVTCGHYGGELMDFTAPNMVEWLKPQLKSLFEMGVKGWWLDLIEPEGEPLQTVYQGGERASIHNVYALLNTRTYYNILKGFDDNERPFILGRTGTAGIQKYGISIWSGDVGSDYETFAAHCGEALNTGMSGIATWTSDTSGFLSTTFDASCGNWNQMYKNDIGAHGLLYERWMQFSCFTPITRGHHVGPAEPYAYGALIEESCKHYLKLRYQLLPYIYTYAYEAHKTGAPIMRPLVFNYQSDNKVIGLKDQYLFGDEMLVAPVFTENTTARKVYFPEGTWIDYDYGYIYEGKKEYVVYAPQNRIPVFIKSGAIIPMAPSMNYVGEKLWDPITYDIYPKGHSSFTMYMDDGLTNDYEKKDKFTLIKISCDEIENTSLCIKIQEANKLFTPTKYQLNIHVSNIPENIELIEKESKKKIEGAKSYYQFNKLESSWYFNNLNNVLYVKYPSSDVLDYNIEVQLKMEKIQKIEGPDLQLTGTIVKETKQQKVAQYPYFLPPATVPCRLQLENFDRGGEGIAYHMKKLGNLYEIYRKEDVNIRLTEDMGGGYELVDILAGEWLEYTINVVEKGYYNLALRVASEEESVFEVYINDKNITGQVRIPNTGGKENWKTIGFDNITLNQGEQVAKLFIVVGKVSVNYLDIIYLD